MNLDRGDHDNMDYNHFGINSGMGGGGMGHADIQLQAQD